MDFDASFKAAEGILSFVQLGTELVSPLMKSYDNQLNAPDSLKLVSERLRVLRSTFSNAVKSPNILAMEQAPGSRSTLHELAVSCLSDVQLLLEKTENMTDSTLGREQFDALKNPESNIKSLVLSRLQQDRMEGLSTSVTFHIGSIVSSRVNEIRRTIESLKSDTRYVRPEQESRVDSISQNLACLQGELERGLADPKTGSAGGLFTQSDLRTIKSLVTRLNEAEDHMIVDKIVASLNYDSRPVRHDSVPQAHKETFRWAFDSRLADWFRSGSNIFWVSGKPGSGKSTFMKFISSHQQTKELLSSWAGSADKLAIAAHFFWIAGTPIQKSWQGLFQSLLFDTFYRQPAVVQLISPRRWAAAKKGEWQTAAEPWSVTELGVALRALATAPEFPLKLCFFIDGLDEYDSDHTELCNILYDMARSPHIKMCLSSRPWPVFEQRFGTDGDKRMDIHELTKDDIRKFVIDQLQLPTDKKSELSLAERDDICQRITIGADGVFLWAFFVTKSLREALFNGDSIADLRNRLKDLPGDLEQLFKTMLESVDKLSHPKMAGILQAASHALEPLHVDLYWMLEKEFESCDYALNCPIRAVTFEQLSKHREQTTDSINDKTKGLLKLVNQRFEFLHRTVKDFVLTRDMEDYLREKLPTDYNGYTAIATAYLGYLKTTSLDNSIIAGVIKLGQGRNSGPFTSHLNQALMYTSEALKSNQSTKTRDLLQAYEVSVDQMIRTGHITLRGINAKKSDSRLLFREELLRHNLTQYIGLRLRDEPDYLDLFEEPPLYFALMPMSLSSGESPAPVPALLDILLRRGQDPNVTIHKGSKFISSSDLATPSPWVLFAREVMSVFNMLSGPCMFPAARFNDSLNNGIFDILLSHGADPNASLLPDRPVGSRTAFSHFLDISLSQFLGAECYEGYLRTLSAFLHAGASLGVPRAVKLESDSKSSNYTDNEEAFGNLAREHPEESVLTSYCKELETLLPRLTADPERAKFVQSAIMELITHCSGQELELQQLASALSKGCPENIRQELLPIIDLALLSRGTTKRNRGSWDGESQDPAVKHLRY